MLTKYEPLLKYCEQFQSFAAKEKKPEAPSKSAPFGEYAWASSREGMPDEPDNELEDIVFAALKNHFASKHVGLPIEIAQLLRMILEMGWYQPVLHAPPLKVLYRGLKIKNKEQLAKVLGINEFEDEGSIDCKDGHVVEVDNGHSTSWTAKKKITKDFSEEGKRGYAVTLIANVADNKCRWATGPGGLYDVDGLSRWHLEKETVGLEPIKIKRIEWHKL